MLKDREERFLKAKKIYEMVDKFDNLNPRERNILFNNINLFISIGSKEYYQNITLATLFKSLRRVLFNGLLFVVFLIVLPIDGRVKNRLKKDFHWHLSMLLKALAR